MIDWFTQSCGGTLVGTGNPLTVNPFATTTYFARARDPLTGCTSAECASTTLIVDPLLPLPDFTTVLLGLDTDPDHRCLADTNHDGLNDAADIQLYVARITP